MRYRDMIPGRCARATSLALLIALTGCADAPDPLAPPVPEVVVLQQTASVQALPDAVALAAALEDAETRTLSSSNTGPLRAALSALRVRLEDTSKSDVRGVLVAANQALAAFAGTEAAEPTTVDAIDLILQAVERASSRGGL